MRQITFRLPLAITVLTLAGCASWRLDKTVTPRPEDVATISSEIEHVRQFQRAVFDVTTFAVDKCSAKVKREPFALMSLGSVAREYSPEQLAAYYRAAGFDETWRVLWATPDSPVQPGDQVVKINGNDIENNSTGAGEHPVAKYLVANYRARQDAQDGDKYIVTLGDGREVAVPTVPACEAQVWAMPLYEENDKTAIPVQRFDAAVLAPNAIRAARTQDEYRYLAGVATYFMASEEGSSRRRTGRRMLILGALGAIAAPVLYPLISPIALSGSSAAAASSSLRAAIFSTQIVAAMGGNPHAGLDLLTRMEAAHVKADRILLAPEEREELSKVISAQHAASADAHAQ